MAMPRSLYLVGYLLCAGVATSAQTVPPSFGESLQADLDTIRNTSTFAGAAVGYAGTMPEVVRAFNRILRTPEPAAAFRSLLTAPHRAAQLYGLAGLMLVAPAEARAALVPLRSVTDSLDVIFGCILTRERVTRLLPSIANGKLPRSLKRVEYLDPR